MGVEWMWSVRGCGVGVEWVWSVRVHVCGCIVCVGVECACAWSVCGCIVCVGVECVLSFYVSLVLASVYKNGLVMLP